MALLADVLLNFTLEQLTTTTVHTGLIAAVGEALINYYENVVTFGDWFFNFDVQEAGGSSFVEFATGINLATAGWDQFAAKLNWMRNKCAGAISSSTCVVVDQSLQDLLAQWLKKLSTPIIRTHEIAWTVTYGFSIVASIAGLYMMYTNRYCAHDWMLLGPLVLFLFSSLVSLGVFSSIAGLITKGAIKFKGMVANIDDKVGGLDISTKEDEQNANIMGPAAPPPTHTANSAATPKREDTLAVSPPGSSPVEKAVAKPSSASLTETQSSRKPQTKRAKRKPRGGGRNG